MAIDLSEIRADKLYTPQETAKFLKIKPSTLAAWRIRERQKLPFQKNGREVYYLGATIKEYLKTSKVKMAKNEDLKKENAVLMHKLRSLQYKYEEDTEALRARVRELERELDMRHE